MDDCEICRRESGDEPALGGWVLRTDHWSACVAEGFEAPGWLFLELRRHAEGPMSMEAEEAAELGPLIPRLSSAVEEVTGAARVDVLAFGELFPHFHVLLAPRLPGDPPELRGPGLFQHRGDLIDADAAGEVAARIRDVVRR